MQKKKDNKKKEIIIVLVRARLTLVSANRVKINFQMSHRVPEKHHREKQSLFHIDTKKIFHRFPEIEFKSS